MVSYDLLPNPTAKNEVKQEQNDKDPEQYLGYPSRCSSDTTKPKDCGEERDYQ